MPHQDEISLSRHTIVRILSATAISLLLASIAGQLAKYALGHNDAYGIIHLFYVDAEANVPTCFSSFLLLLASLLLAIISVLKRRSDDARWRQWVILSCTLLFMAVDEASHIHELLSRPGDWLLGPRLSRLVYFTWAIFGIAFVLVFALSYLKFFLSLPFQTRIQFFAAAATFLSGALGMELVGGQYGKSHGMETFQYSMFATVEEGLEMAGVILLINALLNHIIHHYNIRLSFAHAKEGSVNIAPQTSPSDVSLLQNSY